MKRIKQFQILLVTIPVIVACIQIFLLKTSDLTSWRGGGFGMYSDPHPNGSRNVWIEGTSDGVTTAVRLHPLDERLGYGNMRNTQLSRDLRSLRSVARDARNFPSAFDGARLENAVHDFITEHGSEPVVAELFPDSDLRMKVLEIALTPDYKSIASRTINETKLCRH